MSEEKSRSASKIYAILQKLLPTIKELVSSHSILDRFANTQHRNKNIFYIIRHHEELFGISAAWNYFEVGYGNVSCDGKGGTAERMTDDAVK